jgi:hypothetical protein
MQEFMLNFTGNPLQTIESTGVAVITGTGLSVTFCGLRFLTVSPQKSTTVGGGTVITVSGFKQVNGQFAPGILRFMLVMPIEVQEPYEPTTVSLAAQGCFTV